MEKKTIYVVMYSIQYHDGMVFTYGSYDTELNALKKLPSIIKFISQKACQAEDLGRKLDYFYSELMELESDKIGNEVQINRLNDVMKEYQLELDSIDDYVGFDAVVDDVWVKPMDFYYETITNL